VLAVLTHAEAGVACGWVDQVVVQRSRSRWDRAIGWARRRQKFAVPTHALALLSRDWVDEVIIQRSRFHGDSAIDCT